MRGARTTQTARVAATRNRVKTSLPNRGVPVSKILLWCGCESGRRVEPEARLAVDESVWSRPEPAPEADGGRLVSVIRSDGDWPNWEMHPHGDEVIRLLSGSMVLILETPSGARTIAMSLGETIIVPAGTWHTADIVAAGDALYITLGRATCQRLRNPA
jgi:mannose-6-phosphate isomerase-like protein (cupin superfamily)